jgi:hypothetical protein
LTCASLHGVAGVEVTWLAMSQAWSGHDFANWNIRQNAGTTVGTIDVDSDQAREGYGGFIVS